MENIDILVKLIEKAAKNGFITPEMWGESIYIVVLNSHPEVVLYNKDFAKAFFGGPWKYHIQQMVLSKEPIKYAEKFL